MTETLNATVNSSGGAGAGSGRFVFGGNITGGFEGSVSGAALDTVSGPRDANPFVSGTPNTPFIPGLVGGAEVYGITGLDAGSDLPNVVNTAPANAIAALVYMDLGPMGFEDDYTSFDMLLAVNLDDDAITDLMFGAGAADFKTGLLERGVENNPDFGGSGAVPLAELAAGAVYATLVPNSTSDFQLSAMGFSASVGSMSDGDVLFLVAGLPGDHNDDGTVDAADYVLWRKNPSAFGDAQGYTDWVSNFGQTAGNGAGASANTAAPEPASLLLLMLGAALGVSRRRRSAPRVPTKS